MNRSDAAKKRAIDRKANDPDYFKNLAFKSHEAWEANGRKPRGFATLDKEQHRQVSIKGARISNEKQGKRTQQV
jgi:hypothetical protein